MLGDKLKELRKKLNMSQKDLSQKANVSISYIQQIEANKKTNPSMEILMGLSNALNVNYYDLIECDESIKNSYLINDLKFLLSDLDVISNEEHTKTFAAGISSSINELICTFANDINHHEDIIKLYNYSLYILESCKNENNYSRLNNLISYMEFISKKEGE